MWRCVDFIRTDISEECVASIFRVKKTRATKVLDDFSLEKSFYSVDGGDTLLRNVGSYKTLHSARTQKTAFFIVTARITSDPTQF
jgi:hypothetical protein